MADPVLLVERREGVAVLTLNRPQAMNALNGALRRALAEAFAAAQSDPDTRALILTGAGRAFCAGLDLKELGSGDGPVGGRGDSGADLQAPQRAQRSEGERSPIAAMAAFEGPIIGAINGAAVTGGFEVALACDVLIASEHARFADTHARVGILPGWGLSQRLARAIGIYRAKELSLTGNYLDAAQAERWGLVNRVVPAESLLDHAHALARDMLSVVPAALTAYKRLIDDGFAASFGDGLALEARRSREANRAVTAEELEQRRAGVRERGRAQSRETGR
jgi:enoyl-CoA hydratase